MGIDFITAKAEKYEHRRDKQFGDKIEDENIFSGLPDKTVHQFRCKTANGILPIIGTSVLLYRQQNKIEVFHLNQKIGVVMSPDAAELNQAMQTMGTEVSAARVIEVRASAKIFLIQL